MEKVLEGCADPVESSHASNASNVEDRDEELDVTSEHFNPLKALYKPEYRVTTKQPKVIYQNMAAFETALKKVGIIGLNKKPENPQTSSSKDAKNKKAVVVTEEITRRRFQVHQLAVKTEIKVKSKHHRNIMMQMAQSVGPLKKLQEYVIDGRSVKVLIRKEHGIKGYVEGVLKMFDRHWNLLLVNVAESLEYRKYKYTEEKIVIHQEEQDCSDLLKKLVITLPKQNIKSLGRKRVEIKRNISQLLLRGEHVVLISAKI